MNNDIVPGFDDIELYSLKTKLDKKGDVLIVYLSGYIDTYNSNPFQQRMQRCFDYGVTKVVFNMSGLNYVSSTGIGSFTFFLKVVKPKGGDVVMTGIQPKVHEVFQLLGFTNFFTIVNTMEEAIKSFSGNKLVVEKFPKSFACPICTKKLNAAKSGRFRCPECKTILAVDNEANISLG